MALDYNELPKAARDFLSYMETIQNKSKNTVKEYFYDLRIFFRFIKLYKLKAQGEFDSIKIADINTDLISDINLSDLYAYMTYLSRQRNCSSHARARKAANIKSFFKYAHNKAKIIDINPAQELESPKIMKSLPKYLNLEESKKLLEAIKGKHARRDYAIITLFLNCGLRISELVSIDLNQIRDNILTVVGKGSKERTIYLNDACVDALDRYLEVRPVNGVKDKNSLFLSDRKQRISRKTIHVMIKKHLKTAGLDSSKYSTHKLRHTAATLMYKHGQVDIRTLQRILGHESISTTEIYTHVDNQQLREATARNPLADVKKEE